MGWLSAIGDVFSGNWGSVPGDVAGGLADTFSGGLPISDILKTGSSLFSAYSARDAANTAWDRQMGASNTSYQRGVVDMQKAGLNPGLAYMRGGASVPSASVASTPNMAQDYSALTNASSNAQQVAANIANTRADTTLKAAQASSALAAARASNAQADVKSPEAAVMKDAGSAYATTKGFVRDVPSLWDSFFH